MRWTILAQTLCGFLQAALTSMVSSIGMKVASIMFVPLRLRPALIRLVLAIAAGLALAGCGQTTRDQGSMNYGSPTTGSTGGASTAAIYDDNAATAAGGSGTGSTVDPDDETPVASSTEPLVCPARDEPMMSSGWGFTCGIGLDGVLQCWGALSLPPEPRCYDQVSAGQNFVCALGLDGLVDCWGGVDEYEPGEDPLDVPATPFAQISAGTDFVCGLTAEGEISCWGSGSFGVTTPPGGTFQAIESGSGAACALRADGATVCWGNNSARATEPPESECTREIRQAQIGGTDSWSPPLEFEFAVCISTREYAQVIVAWDYSCGVRPDGQVECWGQDLFGDTQPPEESFVTLSAFGTFTCGITIDGTVACWGVNNELQQSNPPDGEFASIACGANHSCGITVDGEVVCWGGGWGYEPPPEDFP